MGVKQLIAALSVVAAANAQTPTRADQVALPPHSAPAVKPSTSVNSERTTSQPSKPPEQAARVQPAGADTGMQDEPSSMPGESSLESVPPDESAARQADAATAPGPRFVKVLPARHNVDEIQATVGRELRLAFVVEHPRGLPIQLKALGLPHRATFDADLRSIVWRPTEAELGVYQVRVIASDGVKEASHTLLIAVVPNQPPVVGSLWFEAVVGQPAAFLIQSHDPEQSAVHLQVEKLPPGARYEANTARIRWVPTERQVGNHPFVVRASDGQSTSVVRGQISVRAGRSAAGAQPEWTSYLLPGVGYTLYAPRNSDLVGLYQGMSLELLLAAWIHRNDNEGPSHGRLYVNAEVLDAVDADLPLMFTYAAGLSLSFERNPQRTWLVPFYGVEAGGMIHRELGAHFQATPYLGLHLYASPHVFIGVRTGYRLVPRRIDELAGIHTGLNLSFSVW